MKKTTSLALVGVSVLVSACRFDIAAPTVLVGDGENVEIVRSMAANSAMPFTQTTTIYACIAAPTSWGAPLSVTISGTESETEAGTPFEETPTVLSVRTDAMQAGFPLVDHTWYCYKSPAKGYGSADAGQIALTFDADTDRALVFSTLDEDTSATDAAATLDNLAVQDVVRGATYPEGAWEPVAVTIDNPESASANRSLYTAGEYDGRTVLVSDVGSTAPGAPPSSSLYFFNSATDVEVENLSGYQVNAIEVGSDRMVAVLFDTLASENYVGVRTPASSDWVLPETPLPEGFFGLRTDAGSGDYVLLNFETGSVDYSADGVTWESGPATGLAALDDYESTSSAQMVLGRSELDDGLAVVRTAESWDPVLEDWYIERIDSEGDALYVMIRDEPESAAPYDASGDLLHLLRSTDGVNWTKVLGAADGEGDFDLLSFNGTALLVLDGTFYTSNSNGTVWTELDVSDQLPIVTTGNIDIDLAGVVPAGEGAILGIVMEALPPEGEEMFVDWNASMMVYTSDFEDFEVIGGGTALTPVVIGDQVHAFGFDTDGFQLFSFNEFSSTTGAPAGSSGSSSSGGAFLLLPLLWLLRGRRR